MFQYPVEKNTIRFYKYKFHGFEKPVIVEAYNKIQARNMLKDFVREYPALHNTKVISESLSLPVTGETIKKVNGVDMVWVGAISPSSSWMPLSEYKKKYNEEVQG